jgi:glycosidase
MKAPRPAGPAWAWNLPVYETSLDLATPHGRFREFEQRLDALQDLGVGMIWFLPIFPTGGNPSDKPQSNSAYCAISVRNLRRVMRHAQAYYGGMKEAQSSPQRQQGRPEGP